MDFGNALLLVATVFLIVEFANQLIPNLDGRFKVLIAIVAGQLASVLVAHSGAWGAKQVIDGVSLDKMNGAALVLVGLSLAGLAVGLKQGLKAVANIGENHSQTP